MKHVSAFLLALALASTTALAADPSLELAAPFTDHMILQREAKVPVWGFDQPGSKVTVEFAGQSHSAVADKEGDWKLTLDPLEASATERGFKVSNHRGEAVELKGVLVGEVWFASGQSNMVWVAGKSMCSDLARELASSKEDIPIREINIDTLSAIYPQKRATSDGGWKKSKDASGFSALALSFAYQLHKELKVPVGILLSAHSNTRIEAFTARPAIEAHPLLTGDAGLIHRGDPLTEVGAKAFAQYEVDLLAWQEQAIAASKAGGDIPRLPELPGIAGMWRGPSQFFSGKIAPVVPYAIRGAIWCQGTSNSSDGRIYAARMEALLRGWRDAWNMPDMPFYFTQMQCYGDPGNPDNVGFADIRQAQHLFFVNNRKSVGMVVQTDLNSARPQGIHYANKLHPGMRLARWALAKDYGRDIAHTGPIFSGYEVKGGKVVVSFEKDSLFGGLMVGSKGMAADDRDGKYFEPARPTPGEPLNHFRLCGKDGKWHAAEAEIAGDTVVVSSKAVSEPVGVQYAYNAVPMNSNLYNKAGLPATPFCSVDGELVFQPSKSGAAPSPQAVRPMLQLTEYLRNGAVIQRNQEIPIWGHANAGATVAVTLDDKIFTTTANDLEQWSVKLPPLPVNTKGLTLTVETSLGVKREVRDILLGDVWFLMGDTLLTSELTPDPAKSEGPKLEPQPLVREFRKRTKASTNPTPRKRYFETGGGKYRSLWVTADFSDPEERVTVFAWHFAKALDRPGIPQGFISMSSGSGGRSPQMATPLSWMSFDAVQKIDNPAFKPRMDALALQYPETDIARQALSKYLEKVKATVRTIVDAKAKGLDLSKAAPPGFPPFPEAGRNSEVTPDMIPTYAYNWCVSPFTPQAVAGVIWVPSPANIGPQPALYAAELEACAMSLPETFGSAALQFLHAQPAASLVGGIGTPALPKAGMVEFGAWPKSLKEIATEMAGLVK